VTDGSVRIRQPALRIAVRYGGDFCPGPVLWEGRSADGEPAGLSRGAVPRCADRFRRIITRDVEVRHTTPIRDADDEAWSSVRRLGHRGRTSVRPRNGELGAHRELACSVARHHQPGSRFRVARRRGRRLAATRSASAYASAGMPGPRSEQRVGLGSGGPGSVGLARHRVRRRAAGAWILPERRKSTRRVRSGVP
jgi:hypothetical protein